MTYTCPTSLCRLAAALAVDRLRCFFNVCSRVHGRGLRSTKVLSRADHPGAAGRFTPGGHRGAGAPPWPGPLFTLMARLTQDANDTGSETPANRVRLEINDYYQKEAQSSNPGGQTEKNEQLLRMDFPITSTFTFRTDIPYVWKNGDANGLGDIFTRLAYRILEKPDLQFLAWATFIFPQGRSRLLRELSRRDPGFEVRTPITGLHSIVKFRLQEYSLTGQLRPTRASTTRRPRADFMRDGPTTGGANSDSTSLSTGRPQPPQRGATRARSWNWR